jgi:ferredoxin-type protein NapH
MRIPVWPWRRLVQLLVVVVMVALPVIARYSNYLAARQLDKLTERWDGSLQGELLVASDGLMRLGLPDGEGGVPTRRPRQAILDRTGQLQGSPWSARLGALSLTDPLAGAESAVASRAFPEVLLIGLLVPLILTLLLGRVFCGWICPMALLADLAVKLRRLLRFLELPLPNVRFWKGNKYVLLGLGLVFALVVGLPVLHAIYPPALFGREAHGLVGGLFDRAESGALGFALVGLTGASLFLLLVFLAEVAFAPGFWCQSLCPGGALYALLSKLRLLRVRRNVEACSPCKLCDQACPLALGPSHDLTGVECDACGLCLDACPSSALGFHLATTDAAYSRPTGGGPASPAAKGNGRRGAGALKQVALTLAVLALAAGPAGAHHIMGIPHYAYDEDYPQAPVLKLLERVGPWEFQLTGYPGQPEPGVRTQLHVYVVHRETRALLGEKLTLSVHRVAPFGGRERILGPMPALLSQNLFKFFPTYPEEGNYELLLSFPDGEDVSTLRFPLVVGHPGSPWAALGGYLGGGALLLIVVRAVAIKRRRRMAVVR